MTQEIEFYANAFKLAYLVASGEFKTTHEVDGRKVTITRGPGGQFASPGSSSGFVDRVEDTRKFINNAINKKASEFKALLKSESVEAFNKDLASRLGEWLGEEAGDAYRAAVSSLPDDVTRSAKKLTWVANDVARVVKKLPKAIIGAQNDPLPGAKFAAVLGEEFAIAAMAAMVLSSGVSSIGAKLLRVAGFELGSVAAYHGAIRLKAIFNELVSSGSQETGVQELEKELNRQIKKIEKSTRKKGRAMSLSLGVDSSSGEKVVKALEDSGIDPEAVKKALNRQIANREALANHSLHERVLELTQLRQNSNPSQDDKDSIEWHEGVINSELRYGAAIDKLIESADSFITENAEKDYQTFFALIDKGKSESEIRQFNALEKKAIDSLAMLSMQDKHLEINKRQVVERVQECIEAGQLFRRLTKQKLDVRVGFLAPNHLSRNSDEERGYQTNFGIPGLGESFIHTGFFHDAKTLMFHELGHALEAKLGNSAITHNYIKSRTTSTEEVSMRVLENNPAYSKDEKALPSDFISPYTAKIYPGNSEVVSMATQSLANWRALSIEAKEDRDHLMFGLYALDQ